MYPGWTLLWNSKKKKIVNDEEANKNLSMRRFAPRDHLNWC